MLREFGIDSVECHAYVPASYAEVRMGIRYACVREGEDVFVDLGSGMGRVVIAAATYAFHRVIGVELIPQLNDIAARNVKHARERLKCKDVELIALDATKYVIPSEVTVICLFNPFSGVVLKEVFTNIRQSILASPRWLRIILINKTTFEREVLPGCEWIVKRKEFNGIYKNAVYEVACEPHSARGPLPV